MQFNSVFTPPNSIPRDAQIVFVADMFASDYVGGAELTTEALIEGSPLKIHRLRSREVTIEHLKQGVDKHWVFGNFSTLNPNLIPAFVANVRYSILEYDYKYCSYRSPEKHEVEVGKPCDCHEQAVGKHVSAFLHGAKSLWFMSEKQKRKYTSLFPFLDKTTTHVLSSVFSDKTLDDLRALRLQPYEGSRTYWAMLASPSWVKGADVALEWCKQNAQAYSQIWDIPYENVLKTLRHAKGFVYLPAGGDTCPRMVIEAKLLGCELVLNDNVQHKDEEWFATDDLDAIEDYLRASKTLFWNGINDTIEHQPAISGYVTTYNCVQQGYPFIQCIKSLLTFCTEVCIVDGGSRDGTLEELVKLAQPDAVASLDDCVERLLLGKDEFVGNGLRIKVVKRNWLSPRFAVFDGMQKAEARAMCSGDFCWQMDSDEIVHENDAPKILNLCDRFPGNIDLLSLPVIEYWGSINKVRVDINPWKWRLSRNLPHITHGIPKALRRYDDKGELYAAPGTDGCDMIHSETGESLMHASFYTEEAHRCRVDALMGNVGALQAYETWFNQVIGNLPGVHHYSWHDIGRKIRLYRNYWQNHWNSLHNNNVEDSAENNMMFDVPWCKVTESMIDERAQELADKIGGWIWHRKWDGSLTPHMKVQRSEPKVMKEII